MSENSSSIIFENFPGCTGATSICLLDLLNVAMGLQMKNSGNVLLFISRYD